MASPRSRPYTRGYQRMPDDWSQLDTVDWKRPVMIEVGAGTGDWICQEAPRHPDIQYIAIESTALRSAKLIQNARATHASNLIAVRADAVLLLDAKCPPQSVDAFYFHFPNPWPKPRQANKRFFAGSSIYIFDRCLKPGGQIVLASNSEPYVREAAANLARLGYSIQDTTPPEIPRTAFERKYRERGEPIYQISASTAGADRVSLPKDH